MWRGETDFHEGRLTLIGSRTLLCSAKRHKAVFAPWRLANDYDFLSSFEAAKSWISAHRAFVTRIEPVMDEGDPANTVGVLVRLFNGALVDFTFEECFPSHGFIHSKEATSITVNIGLPPVECKMLPAHWHYALLSKLSHLYFAASWRKHARDVVALKKSARILSMKAFMAETSQKQGNAWLKDFYQAKLLENFRHWQLNPSIQGPASPSVAQILPAQLDQSLLLVKFQKQPVLHTLASSPKAPCSLPWAGVTFDWDYFDKLRGTGKFFAVSEILMALAHILYFSPDRKDELQNYIQKAHANSVSLSTETFLCAVEFLCTAKRPPLPVSSHIPPGYAAKVFTYDKPPVMSASKSAHPRVDTAELDGEWNAEVFTQFTHFESAYAAQITLPQVKEMRGTQVSNQLVNFVLDNLDSFLEVPPFFVSFVSSLNIIPPSVELPADMWTVEILPRIDEHLTLCTARAVCRSWRTQAQKCWPALLKRAWTPNSQTKFIPKPAAQAEVNFKQIFAAFKESKVLSLALCAHCNEYHRKVFSKDWLGHNGNEHTEYWCVCEHCDAGSWGSCNQHSTFII